MPTLDWLTREAAEQLKDRLVAMGFEEEEANAYVQPGQRRARSFPPGG